MSLLVRRAGPLTTVQDEGRAGYASWGVSPSGACDRGAHRLGHRLLGNPPGTAGLEVTMGGLVVRAGRDLTLAVTGARCPGAPWNAPFLLPAGAELDLGRPERGLRSYVAVRGGLDVPATLGSRSTDLLSGLGPPRVVDGDRLEVGPPSHPMPGVDEAARSEPSGGVVHLGLTPGPRRDRLDEGGWATLLATTWTVRSDSDRVGARLDGPPLPLRPGAGELPSEGVLRGAVQLPPSGTPVVFLADHPVTGGYPVVAYVRDEDRDPAVLPRPDLAGTDALAQARPGQQVRLHAL